MDQKTWLWKKRSSEKTILATNGDEVKSPPSEKEVHLETSLKALNEKLASALDECSAKEKLAQFYEKMAEESATDKHKAEEEIQCLKQELDEALKQKTTANERLIDLNSALKDCMEQLNQVREEQDQKIHDAVIKTSKEFEKALEELTVERTYLGKALLVKEKLIEDLNDTKSQTEAEFEALMTRLDSIEKENSFLRYEFRTLEKELDLRNEELEYIRRCSESSHKQHLENIKKIKKLESECQRLRSLTRKRISNPEIQGRDHHQIDSNNRRKKGITGSSDNPSKKLSFLSDHVQDLEKENKILRECLAKKEEEILYFQKMESSARFDFTISTPPAPDELSFTSGYEIVESNDVGIKTIGASDMKLMDDFVEMEKLAIVAIDPPLEVKAKDLFPVKTGDWLTDITDLIVEQHGISKRSVCELLEDIKMALDSINGTEKSESLPISGYITWKDASDECLNQDYCTNVRDIFGKHLGGDGPGTAMELESVKNLMSEIEKIYSVSREEVARLENELKVKLLENEELMDKLEKSEKKVTSLENEVGILKESKRMTEDQIENQKLINEDLDTQLSVTKAKLNEVVQKLASVEVELENKNYCFEELEGTCLELQLQLESITSNRHLEDDEDQEELLRTGMEITKASAKLAECEKNILNLGKQLKAMGSAKELSVVDKVLSITSSGNKKFKQRPSLRDHILSEESGEAENQQSPKTKEIISMSETNAPSAFQAFSFPDGQVATPKMKNETRNANSGSLVIVPSKRRGGIGFLRKLLLRKKKASSSKNSSFYFSK